MVQGPVVAAGTAAGLLLLVVWALALGAVVLVTRYRSPDPAPPTAELPAAALPPAVVAYLTQGLVVGEDAVESTLVDLAARGHVELRQADGDPRSTTVHPGPDRAAVRSDHLLPFEVQVLARVRAVLRNGVAPVAALQARGGEDVEGWWREFAQEVRRVARARVLVRDRVAPHVRTTIALGAGPGSLVLGTAISLPAASTQDRILAMGLTVLVLWGGAWRLVDRVLRGDVLTDLGRAEVSRWLGVQAFLRGDGAFGAQPPAAVAVWDRYLAYGDALGVTTVVRSVLDFGLGDRSRVWSAYGGTWRMVRVRYPEGGTFGQTSVARAVAGLWLAGPIVVLVMSSGALGALAVDGGPWWAGPAASALLLGAGLLVTHAVWMVVTAVVGSGGSRATSGEVIWMTPRVRDSDRSSRTVAWSLAVDDGASDRTTAWYLPVELADDVRPGDVVRLTGHRFSRRVVALERVARTAAGTSAAGRDDVRYALVHGPLAGVAWRLLATRPTARSLAGAGAEALVDGRHPARWAGARSGDRVATLTLPAREVPDDELAARLRAALDGGVTTVR
ncbi:DUF2207 domain-containing protein [Kineosporia sp. A_224]|uniref:DUF2207 family protein n=1 Tax=Kineosporia sp. A_224 TaxID=1962180 RepID=UPI0013043278|nr:DUF2207 domain-containing protein [Kineosporia sp. A_224]